MSLHANIINAYNKIKLMSIDLYHEASVHDRGCFWLHCDYNVLVGDNSLSYDTIISTGFYPANVIRDYFSNVTDIISYLENYDQRSGFVYIMTIKKGKTVISTANYIYKYECHNDKLPPTCMDI